MKKQNNKRQSKETMRPSHSKHCSYAFVCVCVYACAISSLVLSTSNKVSQQHKGRQWTLQKKNPKTSSARVDEAMKRVGGGSYGGRGCRSARGSRRGSDGGGFYTK